nr:hypothetical protein [Candidatus Dormibacteraeota bacterium]
MTAVLSKAFGDLRRHPMQAVVVALIVLLASGTGVIALTLMTQSNNPYDQAFAQQNGAHLQAYFNGAKVDSSLLPSTAQAIGATEYAGPFPSGGIAIERGSVKFFLNLIGRDSPTAAVDRIHVVDGRWVSAPNDIALTKSFADLNNISIGARFKDVDLPQAPTVTVVGLVVDIDEGQADLSSQTAFVTASALSLLVPKDAVGYA